VSNRCYNLANDGDLPVGDRIERLGNAAFDAVFDGDDTALETPVVDCFNDGGTDSRNETSSATALAARCE